MNLTTTFEQFFQLKQPHERVLKSKIDVYRGWRRKVEVLKDRYSRSKDLDQYNAVRAHFVLQKLNNRINELQG